MTPTLEMVEDLMRSINKTVRNPDALEELLTWLESEIYGGEVVEMRAEAQTLMLDFVNLIQQAEIDFMRCGK